MKKSAKRLTALIAVLVVLIAGFAALKLFAGGGEGSDGGASETVAVGALSGEVTELSFTGNDGEPLAFIKKDGKWLYRETEALPIQQSYIERIASLLPSLTATRKLSISDTLSAYGLETPANTVSAYDDKGASLTLLIGKSTTGGCYAMEKDVDAIYIIASTLTEYLDINLDAVTEKDELPSVTEKEADAAALEGAGRSLIFTKARKANGTGIWYMGEDDTGVQAAAYELGEKTARDYLDTLFKAMEQAKLGSLVKFFPSGEEKEAYGLTSPALTLRIDYSTDEAKGSYTLYIGGKAGDDYYYVSLDGSDAVYLISSDTVSKLQSVLDAFPENP